MLKAIALGKVVVAAAGTPVLLSTKLSAAQLAMITPQGGVAIIDFVADPAMVGTQVYVKNAAGVIIAPILKPANGADGAYRIGPSSANLVNVNDFSVDVQTSNDGVYVTLWVC